MKWFCTSDTHFGHWNICKYCERPFSSVGQMNKVLIDNWNSRVKDEDTVFVLGDFCFKNTPGGKNGEGEMVKAEFHLRQLKGNKICIKGNHDQTNSLHSIIESMEVKYGGHHINMVHRPEHAKIGRINLVGHVHNHWKVKKLDFDTILLNVGVDAWNFMPITLDEAVVECNKALRDVRNRYVTGVKGEVIVNGEKINICNSTCDDE